MRICALLIVVAVFFGALEKLWPARSRKFFRYAFGTDVVYYFVSSFVPKLLLIAPLALLASAAHHAQESSLAGSFYDAIGDLPFAVRFLASLLVGEIGAYWGHRWCHQVPFLWRFHALHHSAEEIDWLVNTRAHPLDMVFTRLCGLVPMYLLGFAQPAGTPSNQMDLIPVLVALAATTWGFFIHANLRWRFSGLEVLVSTPAFHHWHHTNDAAENLNKNYAAVLPLVDKLFGTFYLPKTWPGKYGTDTYVPASIADQLMQPLTTPSFITEESESNGLVDERESAA